MGSFNKPGRATLRFWRVQPAARTLIPVFALGLFLGGCAGEKCIVSPAPQVPLKQGIEATLPKRELPRMGYSIQAGAFSNLDNAILLVESLERRGLNAYYFRHKTGIFKVRFGDFSSEKAARSEAGRLHTSGIIHKYYIVSPDDYALAKERVYGGGYLRNRIVETAESFIGLPYRWGGSSADGGFDCSGLAMVVYRLNGLKLPRSSRQQYRAGNPVGRPELERGDLVFFATSGGKRVSHVGVYSDDNRFVHAPGKGKTIRIDSLSNRYYAVRYVGARTYLK
jgi:cell wall-associated NlpC family hydrolase